MFDHLVKENGLTQAFLDKGLGVEELNFIKEMINPKELKGIAEKNFVC